MADPQTTPDPREIAPPDLSEAQQRVREINQILYEIKGQLKADEAAGYPRGDEWRFRAEEARRHYRAALRPLTMMLDEASRPQREAKKSARREQIARLAEANTAVRTAKAFRKVVREALGDAEFNRLCLRAFHLSQTDGASFEGRE